MNQSAMKLSAAEVKKLASLKAVQGKDQKAREGNFFFYYVR